MTAVIFGLGFILLGAWGLLYWFQDFLMALRGFGPISILIGGVVALISGIASFRVKNADDKSKE
jgi:hypothetical protein